jgi:uncharacterized protein YjbJ (UPF0337 family)
MNQVRGEFKKQWCRMTGDGLGRLSGRMLKLKGKVQVRYGRVKDAAGKRIGKLTRH